LTAIERGKLTTTRLAELGHGGRRVEGRRGGVWGMWRAVDRRHEEVIWMDMGMSEQGSTIEGEESHGRSGWDDARDKEG
jgi:hypothetical protein